MSTFETTANRSSHNQPVALITGGSRGLGLALAIALRARGWRLIVDARGGEHLSRVATELGAHVTAIAGDVTDPAHRAELIGAADSLGRLDLLVNNASILGASPQPTLAEQSLEILRHVYEVNTVAPLALFQAALPLLRGRHVANGKTPGDSAAGDHLARGAGASNHRAGDSVDPGAVINISSDAAVGGYAGWGGYGSSKAALDQLSNVLAAEHPELRVYWVDPGDMNTQLHQEAAPGEDLSSLPPPEASVPGLLRLISERPPSGRYLTSELGGAT